MTPRALALPALIAALLSGPTLAVAQEAVATARSTAGAPDVAAADVDPSVDGVISTASTVTGPPMTTDQKIANILSAARHADESDEREVSGPRQIHGTASVSVGTGGYRAASVSALMPVGENGMVGVAYAQSQGGRGFGYGYGPGFGPMGGDGVNRALGLSFSYDATKDGAGCRTTDQSLDAQRRARWAGHDDRPACRLRDD